jgi:hypothetical protein
VPSEVNMLKDNREEEAVQKSRRSSDVANQTQRTIVARGQRTERQPTISLHVRPRPKQADV